MGIRGKLLYSIVALTLGYVLFLGLVEWTAAMTKKHLQVASGALFPAAASIQLRRPVSRSSPPNTRTLSCCRMPPP